jgi:hypothetical protein
MIIRGLTQVGSSVKRAVGRNASLGQTKEYISFCHASDGGDDGVGAAAMK